MKAIVTGAVFGPYEIKDKDSGEVKTGESGSLYFVKGKPSQDKKTKGFECGMRKCLPEIAKALHAHIAKNGQWLVCDIDLDTKGRGDYEEIIIADMDILGPISQFSITADGIKAREKVA